MILFLKFIIFNEILIKIVFNKKFTNPPKKEFLRIILILFF